VERECIQALYEKRVTGPDAAKPPSQLVLAKWVGASCNTQFKNALATVVKAGYVSNHKHRGKRGGYFLTPLGTRAGAIICDQS
jgi:hypothetical protein